MKILFGFIFGVLIIGCVVDEEVVSIGDIPSCGVSTPLFSPEGYFVNHLGGIDVSDYTVSDFHFSDDFNGFLIAYDKDQAKSVIQKTTDGGVTWQGIILPSASTHIISLPSSFNLKDLVFKDKEVASLFTYTSVMFKTDNGGLTWNPHATQKGLNHYAFAENNKMFASDYNDIFYVSNNNGESWSVLSDHPEFDFRYTSFSFKIIGEKIYALGKDDKLIVINLDGEYLNTLFTGVDNVSNIHVLNDSIFVVSSYSEMAITTDEGLTFSKYYNGVAKMIDLQSQDEAVMVIQTGGSSGDGIYTCDKVAYTVDGGLNWIQGENCTMNLNSNFKGSQKMSTDRSIAFFRNCVFEIKLE